jgi:hypothetical protein
MSITISDQSILNLATLLVVSTEYGEVIKDFFVESKITKKLNIILSIIEKKVKDKQPIEAGKLLNDYEMVLHYLFPLMYLTLNDRINELLVGLMETTAEKFTNGDYLNFCNYSKQMVEDFKIIKFLLVKHDVSPKKMTHFKQL